MEPRVTFERAADHCGQQTWICSSLPIEPKSIFRLIRSAGTQIGGTAEHLISTRLSKIASGPMRYRVGFINVSTLPAGLRYRDIDGLISSHACSIPSIRVAIDLATMAEAILPYPHILIWHHHVRLPRPGNPGKDAPYRLMVSGGKDGLALSALRTEGSSRIWRNVNAYAFVVP